MPIKENDVWRAIRIAYNRGRFELADEIEKETRLASTIDADALRAILYGELGSDSETTPPTREERNSEGVDKQRRVPDYILHRCGSVFK